MAANEEDLVDEDEKDRTSASNPNQGSPRTTDNAEDVTRRDTADAEDKIEESRQREEYDGKKDESDMV